MRLHYKEDNVAILLNECNFAYVLAVQEKWADFDEHLTIFRQSSEKLDDEKAIEGFKKIVDMIEKVSAEKDQNINR